MQLLVFELNDHLHALHAQPVREVLRAVAASPVPGAASPIEGTINLRGRPVPLIGLRARLGLAPAPLHSTEHFIVVEHRGQLFALRVDRVFDLVEIEDTDPLRPQTGLDDVVTIKATSEGDALVRLHALERLLPPG